MTMTEERLMVLEVAFKRLERKFQQREKWCEILNMWILQQFDYNIETYWLELIGDEVDEDKSSGHNDTSFLVEVDDDDNHSHRRSPLLESEGFYAELPISIDYDDNENSRDAQVQDPLEYLQRVEEMDDEIPDADYGINKKYVIPSSATNSFVENEGRDEESQGEGNSNQQAGKQMMNSREENDAYNSDEETGRQNSRKNSAEGMSNYAGAQGARVSSNVTLEHLLSIPPKQSGNDIDSMIHRLEERSMAQESNRNQSYSNNGSTIRSHRIYTDTNCAQEGMVEISSQSASAFQPTSALRAQLQNPNHSHIRQMASQIQVQNVTGTEQQLQIIQAQQTNPLNPTSNFQTAAGGFMPYPFTFVPLAIALTSSPAISEPSIMNSSTNSSPPQLQSGGDPNPGSGSAEMNSSEVQLRYPCPRCRKQFCDADALETHMKTHRGKQREKIGHCEHCGKIYRTWKFFQKHCQACTVNKDKGNSTNNNDNNAENNQSESVSKKPKKVVPKKRPGSMEASSPEDQSKRSSNSMGKTLTTGQSSAPKASLMRRANACANNKALLTNMYEPQADDLVVPSVFKNTGIKAGRLLPLSPTDVANKVNSTTSQLNNPTISTGSPNSSSTAATTSNAVTLENQNSDLNPNTNQNQNQNHSRSSNQSDSSRKNNDDEAVLVFNCKVCRLAFPSLNQCRQHIVATHLAQVLETPVFLQSGSGSGSGPAHSLTGTGTGTGHRQISESGKESLEPVQRQRQRHGHAQRQEKGQGKSTHVQVLSTNKQRSRSRPTTPSGPTSSPKRTSRSPTPKSAPIPIPTSTSTTATSSHFDFNFNIPNQAYSIATPTSLPNLIANTNNSAATLLANLQFQNLPHLANLANFVNFQNLSHLGLASSINPNMTTVNVNANPNTNSTDIANSNANANSANLASLASLAQFQNLAQFANSQNFQNFNPQIQNLADLANTLHLNALHSNLSFNANTNPNQGQSQNQNQSQGGISGAGESNESTGFASSSQAPGSKSPLSLAMRNRSNGLSKLKSLLLQEASANKDETSRQDQIQTQGEGQSQVHGDDTAAFVLNAATSPENMYPYICLHCKRQGVTQGFGSDQEIHEHILKYHVTTIRFHCPFSFCQQVFLEQDAFEEHIVSDHQVPA